jgi:mono/diheme cytochrome c family protein
VIDVHPSQRCCVLAWVLGWAALGACATEDTHADDSSTEQALRPDWHRDVAPILHEHCVDCHRQGGSGPFSLADYGSAAPWASLMSEVVAERSMPPWGAHETKECEPVNAWVDDMRLREDEITTIRDWVTLGAPEGDPADAAPLPTPVDRSLADPSDIFENPSPTVLENQADRFVCFSLDTGLDEDVWITGVELLPDNAQVVHHVLIFLDESGASAELVGPDGSYPCADLHLGALLGSYFPGSPPTELPAEVGIPFPVGARIVLNYHYHPTGSGHDVDQSSLAVRWTNQAPAYDGLISSLGNATTAAGGLLPGPNDPDGVPTFFIPSGASGHTETMQITVPEWLPELELFMLGPHMHEVGVDLLVTHERDGEERCLLHDPGWDPDWQRLYTIDATLGRFPTIRGGDRLTLRCTYDNTLDNPAVVEALARFGLDQPIHVYFGSAGLDEMCMFIYGLALPR